MGLFDLPKQRQGALIAERDPIQPDDDLGRRCPGRAGADDGPIRLESPLVKNTPLAALRANSNQDVLRITGLSAAFIAVSYTLSPMLADLLGLKGSERIS
jgi:hypothetical protein